LWRNGLILIIIIIVIIIFIIIYFNSFHLLPRN